MNQERAIRESRRNSKILVILVKLIKNDPVNLDQLKKRRRNSKILVIFVKLIKNHPVNPGSGT